MDENEISQPIENSDGGETVLNVIDSLKPVEVESESCAVMETSESLATETPQIVSDEMAPENDVVRNQLRELSDQQGKLLEFFDEKFRYDAVRDQTIDKLHSELQDHRNDMMGKVALPILRDLIRLNDELSKFISARREFPEEKRDWTNLLDNVGSFGEDIIDILDRYGLAAFTEVGKSFNPRTQRATKTMPTDDSSLDRTIAQRLRPGFRWGDRVIRNEEVVVYKTTSVQIPAVES